MGPAPRAIADLRRLERDHTEFLSPHNYLAEQALLTSDDLTYLEESGLAAAMTRDGPRQTIFWPPRGEGLKKGGHRAMLQAIYDAQARLFEAGIRDAYDEARVAAMLGQRKSALASLDLAIDRHEPSVVTVNGDPAFRNMAGDAEFRRLTRKITPYT